MLGKLGQSFFEALNRRTVWHKLPTLPLRAANLIALRTRMREENLYDTQRGGFPPPERELSPEEYRRGRTVDGSYNDLSRPMMGARGMRFGRNIDPAKVRMPDAAALLEPNPREVARRLLRRQPGEFHAVPYLNVLAAAWLQFMTHDWFGHNRDDDDPHQVPIADDDDWPQAERPMRFGRSKPDPATQADKGMPPAFANTESHWWDSSQVYGDEQHFLEKIRTGRQGKLLVREDGRLEVEPETGLERTGMNDNWWVGLSLLHTVFTLEHNMLCDRLVAAYPERAADDQWLFDKARLINAAVIAKIHTVEWTPALLNNATMRFAMRGNWWGVLGEKLYRRKGRFSASEVLQGIPGSAPEHHAAPYSLTEEFVAVYRMHPLLPDEFNFRRLADDAPVAGYEAVGFRDISGRRTVGAYEAMSLADAAYSLGTRNPGQVRLHNYPIGLMRFERQDSSVGPDSGQFIDLATIDVMRDRERGVPRYNDFRRMLRMPALTSFDQLTANRDWVREIEDLYGGDLEKVDTIVGLLAEDPPEGFGFSDTAFRIFILMASRRLKSDRFFTGDYNAETYTELGMKWIDDTLMSDVLLRHWPQLRPAMGHLTNAFFLWEEAKA